MQIIPYLTLFNDIQNDRKNTPHELRRIKKEDDENVDEIHKMLFSRVGRTSQLRRRRKKEEEIVDELHKMLYSRVG